MDINILITKKDVFKLCILLPVGNLDLLMDGPQHKILLDFRNLYVLIIPTKVIYVGGPTYNQEREILNSIFPALDWLKNMPVYKIFHSAIGNLGYVWLESDVSHLWCP